MSRYRESNRRKLDLQRAHREKERQFEQTRQAILRRTLEFYRLIGGVGR